MQMSFCDETIRNVILWWNYYTCHFMMKLLHLSFYDETITLVILWWNYYKCHFMMNLLQISFYDETITNAIFWLNYYSCHLRWNNYKCHFTMALLHYRQYYWSSQNYTFSRMSCIQISVLPISCLYFLYNVAFTPISWRQTNDGTYVRLSVLYDITGRIYLEYY